jgi:hypothetical protein
LSRRWGGGTGPSGPAGPSGAPDGGSPVWLTAGQAEDLLSGRPGPAGSEALAGVLAALAGPAEPREAELAGYDRIRQAFEAAGAADGARRAGSREDLGAARSPRGGSRSVSGLRPDRGLAVRAGVLAAALSVAGVGTAAAANSLPSGLQQLAHDVFGGIGVPAPEDAGTPGISAAPSGPTPTGAAGRTHGATSGPTTPAGTTPMASASAESVALCRAYGEDGDGLSGEQQERLAVLAGGKQHVAKYCKAVLAAETAASSASTSADNGGTTAAGTAATTGNGNGNGNANGGGNGNANGGGNGNANGGGNGNANGGGNGNANGGGNGSTKGNANGGANGNANGGGNGNANGATKGNANGGGNGNANGNTIGNAKAKANNKS